MICDELIDLFELYALGVLEPAEYTQVKNHLETGCDRCGKALGQAANLNAVVLANVATVEPPARLRSRIVAMVTPASAEPPKRNKSSFGWIGVAAALAAVAVWLGSDRQHLVTTLAGLRSELTQEQQERRQLDAAFSFLKDPQTRPAVAKPELNKPRGTYFVNPTAGVLLVASNLPQLDSSKTYEMWVIPKGQAPRPAGLFRPDPAGTVVHIGGGAVDLAGVAALAISVEPAGGSPAPSTTPQLVTPLQGL